MDNAYFIVYIATTNDTNGNPRRGFQVYDINGDMIDFVNEGYHGTGQVRQMYPDIPITGRVAVNPSEYRESRKEFKNRSHA